MVSWLIFAFLTKPFGVIPLTQAQEFSLVAPGVMVHLSLAFNPPVLKGIKVHPDNPLRFDFILDKGDSHLSNDQLKDESSRLIKYFLASLTIPEKDLWVNLSTYEKNRIVPEEFGQTEMGRDLLAEDYMLKEMTASLIYPEEKIGKEFWQKIYARAQAQYGTTNIPVNTFNKVWIVPEKAVVYENGGTAFVLENHLKVMLEEDYLALSKHQGQPDKALKLKAPHGNDRSHTIASRIVRSIILPQLEKEVNTGKNFAQLRQVFYSLILATWYKKKIKGSMLNQVYSNQNKIRGVSVSAQDKDIIYQEYLKAFKKGVFNYIKEEPDPVTRQILPRKYFSGGVNAQQIFIDMAMVGPKQVFQKDLALLGPLIEVEGDFSFIKSDDQAMAVNMMDRNGYGFSKAHLNKFQKEYIKIIFAQLITTDFTAGEKESLANALTRIKRESLLLRTGFFTENDVDNVLSFKPFGTDNFVKEIKRQRLKYEAVKRKGKRMFSDRKIS